MNTLPVRVRFAPSPTGGLHLGGVRTVLYNYLFAHKYNGTFVLRIEDTDQSRYVATAEQYIYDCLSWCGLNPTESPAIGGPFAPYKQSERKENGLYSQYAHQLVTTGYAYYAFDTPEELEVMRITYKTAQNPSPQYDASVRLTMKNSLSLTNNETKALLQANTPYVIRIKVPSNQTITLTDVIRGTVSFDSNLLDDKVLLKKDGMPTYHLAVVVDDYLMQITHALRGEEWLPSAPIHVLLWQYLGWLNNMPQWVHLPLILGPHGKLSKRDGAKYGYPVYAMDWTDDKTKETTHGFKEMGFLPEAFINILAMLGWHGTAEKELYTLQELVADFSLEKVHAAGAKFDYEKAKWYNQEWIKKLDNTDLAQRLQLFDNGNYGNLPLAKLATAVALVKERCQLLSDFWVQLSYFFYTPTVYDWVSVTPKWSAEKATFFKHLIIKLTNLKLYEAIEIETEFKNLATELLIKPGELQLPLRIMLVGQKYGPTVFTIATFIGKDETISRVTAGLAVLS